MFSYCFRNSLRFFVFKPRNLQIGYLQDFGFFQLLKNDLMINSFFRGGGIYEQEAFYTIADELGIMIWQDFMFACSMYQSTDDFLASVEDEVRHQIWRLQSHPSIVLWAGNNENEAALVQNWYGTNANFDLYKRDYLKLYKEVIERVVQEENPGQVFALSSPSNGYKTSEVGGVNENPQDNFYGDIHFYSYYVDGWNPISYPQGPRFVSEYGWQSFPSFNVLKNYSSEVDWSLSSKFAQKRQRHPNGNLELPMQIMTHLDCPDFYQLSTPEGFREFLYLSQISQAEQLRTETEVYRRAKSKINPETGSGMTMGALYWQLNDVWPGASWTSLEYGGNWRMSHYFAKEMFSNVLVSPTLPAPYDKLKITIVSDLPETLKDLRLYVKVQRFDSFSYIGPSSYVTVEPFGVVEKEFDMKDFLFEGNCMEKPSNIENFNLCFITAELTDPNTNKILSQNKLMNYLKSVKGLKIPNLTISSVKICQSNCNLLGTSFIEAFDITIKTDAVALYVWLEAEDISGHFDKNGFLMDKPTFEVKFFAKSNVTSGMLTDALSIRSYKNSLE